MKALATAIVTVFTILPVSASAQSVRVSRFTAERTCSTYILNSGSVIGAESSAGAAEASDGGIAVATRHSAMVAATWRQDLVQDCKSNFPGLRASIERALATGGVGAGGHYTLSGRVSGLTSERADVRASGYDLHREMIVVSVEYDLRDAQGRAAAGGLLTKRVPLSDSLTTDGYEGSQTQATGYAGLQREVALAVARGVAFRLAPLRVVAVEGDRIRLNHGAGLLPVGSMIRVEAGMTSLRFLVSSADGDSALADLDGSGDVTRIRTGATATFIDADDPAASTPRYDRVDLPQ